MIGAGERLDVKLALSALEHVASRNDDPATRVNAEYGGKVITAQQDQIARVRELHKPMAWDRRFCDHCEPLVPDPRHVFYPCPTILALDGPAVTR